jgi:hypothetical protein
MSKSVSQAAHKKRAERGAVPRDTCDCTACGAPFDRAPWTGYGEGEEPLLLGAGAFGVTGIALDPFPVVLDDAPGPMPGVVASGAPESLEADGAVRGGVDEPELESLLSQATSAKVASVAPIAMIVFLMIRLSEWLLHRSVACRFWAKRSLLKKHGGGGNLSLLASNRQGNIFNDRAGCRCGGQ